MALVNLWVRASRFPSSCLLSVLAPLMYSMAKNEIISDYPFLTLEASQQFKDSNSGPFVVNQPVATLVHVIAGCFLKD